MLFVTIRSATAVHVPKVLQVVEHTKRLRHKAGTRIKLRATSRISLLLDSRA